MYVVVCSRADAAIGVDRERKARFAHWPIRREE